MSDRINMVEPDRLAIILVFLAHVAFYPYFPSMRSANEWSRLYLVEAMTSDHDVATDRPVWQWGYIADLSRVALTSFSDKPPGTAFLALPFVAIRQWLDGGPDIAADLRVARLVTGVIPTLILLLLLRIEMARLGVSPPTRAICILGYGLGSLGFTYSLLFYGHQLVAVLLYATWWVLRHRTLGPWEALLVGFLASLCLATEYQSILYLAPLGVVFILRARPVHLAFALAGAAPLLCALGLYHNAAFGGPLRTGYNYLVNEPFATYHRQGFMGLKFPTLKGFTENLFLPSKGLFVWSPHLALGFMGLYKYKKVSGDRLEFVLRLTLIALPVLFVASMVYIGGWTVGQRHFTPMVPFLIAPLAVLVDQSRWARVMAPALVLASIMMTGTATVTFPHLPEWYGNPFHDLVVPLLQKGCVAAAWAQGTIGAATVAGLFGALVLLAIIAAVSLWPDRMRLKVVAVILMALLPIAWYDLTSRVQRFPRDRALKELVWFENQCADKGGESQ